MVKHGAKKVKISEQRQITIPEEFYDALNFQHEVIIEFIGKAIVILPNETVNKYARFYNYIYQSTASRSGRIARGELLEEYLNSLF